MSPIILIRLQMRFQTGEGVMRVAQTRKCPRLQRSVPPYREAQGANGSDGVVRSAL